MFQYVCNEDALHGIVKRKGMISEDDCIFHIGAMAKTVPDTFLLFVFHVCLLWTPVENALVYVLHHVSWGLFLSNYACEWAELCK